MKLGLFGGGFKPFTAGHYAKVRYALERCDRVLVFYGVGARDKGEISVTADDATRLFRIVSRALPAATEHRASVVLGVPTPIKKMFAVVGAVKDGQDHTDANLTASAIEVHDVEELTIFSDPTDVKRFTDHIGTDRGTRYYGDLIERGILRFDTCDLDGLVSALRSSSTTYDKATLDVCRNLTEVRASQVRDLVARGQVFTAVKLLAPIFSDDEIDQTLAILQRGIK